MKTRSFYYRTLPLCAVVLALVASLRADDLRLRIKIPNPIPRIVKGIERVSERVGDVVIRTAERIDGEDESEDLGRGVPSPYLAPAPPPGRVTVRIESPRPPVDPRRPTSYQPPLVPDSPRSVAPPQPRHLPRSQSPQIVLSPLPPGHLDPSDRRSGPPTFDAPSDARRSPDGTTVKAREPSYRPTPPSAAGSPLAAVTTPSAGGQPTAAANAEKPTPPPQHAYGKPVPGRPGLAYPPGMKEIPENMIDVRGITPGTKVRDPATKMIFRVP